MILLKQCFSSLKVFQTHLKDLLKHGFLGSTSSILTQDLTGWSLRIWFSNKFPGDGVVAGPEITLEDLF